MCGLQNRESAHMLMMTAGPLAICFACRHVRDVFWWLEHVCGINMLDYEEKVVVTCLIVGVLVLILLGAYKQSTQLLHLLKQMAFPGPN
jgi:hypothetical protein